MRIGPARAFTGRMTNVASPAGPRSSSRTSGAARRVVRRIVIALVVLLALMVLLFFLGGGWYFSGKIRADGLEVKPWQPQYGQSVVAADRSTITIADPADEQPVLDGDDVWGLQWKGGYGQVSGSGSAAARVTRDFNVLTGKKPRADEPVALDRSAFPEDAPDVALDTPVEDVMFTSPAGTLPAWFVPGKGSTWAVLVHGKGAHRAEMLRAMRTTVGSGLPSLAITYRNDAGAPADPSGFYQFGRTEWEDLDGAITYAQEQGAEKVVVVCVSMGCGITAAYLRNVPDGPVAGLFLDSPMLDFGETVSYGASQEPLPVLGHVPEPLTWTAKQITRLRFGIDWSAVDYLDDTSWVTVPTLTVHGTDDETVPVSTSERLRDEQPDLVTYESFDGAGHAACWNSDPDRYDALLADFLSDI